MRVPILVALLAVTTSTAAFAQGSPFPTVEVFGGYSFITSDILETPEVVPGGRDSFPVGWNVAATYSLADNLGITGEVGGHYGSQAIGTTGDADLTYHTFLFGPKLVHRDGKVEMSFHALVGLAHAVIDHPLFGNNPDTDFTFALGGGVDYLAGKIGIRILQVDYVQGELYQSVNNTVRFTAGVFWRK